MPYKKSDYSDRWRSCSGWWQPCFSKKKKTCLRAVLGGIVTIGKPKRICAVEQNQVKRHNMAGLFSWEKLKTEVICCIWGSACYLLWRKKCLRLLVTTWWSLARISVTLIRSVLSVQCGYGLISAELLHVCLVAGGAEKSLILRFYI